MTDRASLGVDREPSLETMRSRIFDPALYPSQPNLIGDLRSDAIRLLYRLAVLAALATGPKSSDELLDDMAPLTRPDYLRAMERDGLIAIDPDAFPDEFVPGNPFIARLPGDERPWPGWSKGWRR